MRALAVFFIVVMTAVVPFYAFAADNCSPRQCLPERPVPPETLGGIGVPFDVPVYPTIVKTEFHILPWVNFGKCSICLPYCSKPIEIPAPCFSLQPVPVWFPWLRPVDSECKGAPPVNAVP